MARPKQPAHAIEARWERAMLDDIKNFFLGASFAAAIVCGAFLGEHACGANVWYYQVNHLLIVLFYSFWAVLAVFQSIKRQKSTVGVVYTLGLVVGWYCCLVVLNSIAAAATAPLYPNGYVSFGDWFNGFVSSLANPMGC